MHQKVELFNSLNHLKSKLSSIRGKIRRMDFAHGRNGKEISLTFHKNVCTIPGSCSENRHRFFKPSPASNFF